MITIKGIIFDMDGVLVDAKQWHYEALNRALALFGFDINRFEHLSRYDGLPTRRKLEMLTEDKQLPASLHGFINDMKQQYLLEEARQKCQPNPVHVDALTRLRQDGFQLAMASNSIRATVDFLVQRTGVDRFLAFWLSNQDVDRPKPDPEIYLKAASKLGLQADQCLVVEDGVYGIEAAHRAGCHVFPVSCVNDVNYLAFSQFLSQLHATAASVRAA